MAPAVAIWQKDDECTECNTCKRPFTITRRRHHCRRCGFIFCNSCSSQGQYQLRLCRRCKYAMEAEMPSGFQTDKLKEFEVLCFLGEGAYGKVYKVRSKANGKVFALKVVQKDAIKNARSEEQLWDETHLLQIIEHPFIVKLHRTFQTPDNLFLLMDFLPGGDCYYLLTKNRFPEEAARLYAAQIALALDYLHSHNILYRDLKPENCLLDAEGNMVLTDMGLARVCDENKRRRSRVGTPSYWAPERFDSIDYTKAVDYWSLGCLLFEVMTGFHPFQDSKGNVVPALITKTEPKFRNMSEFSPECIDFCRLLLIKDPTQRLHDHTRLRSHPWFRGLDWTMVQEKKYPVPWKPPMDEVFDPAYTSAPAVINTRSSGCPGRRWADFSWANEDPLCPQIGVDGIGVPQHKIKKRSASCSTIFKEKRSDLETGDHYLVPGPSSPLNIRSSLTHIHPSSAPSAPSAPSSPSSNPSELSPKRRSVRTQLLRRFLKNSNSNDNTGSPNS